jgi:iron complex outermembrane receptor protein
MDFDGLNTVLSTYVQDEHQLLPFVSVLGGLRFDSYSAGVDALSPRMALIVTPARHTVLKLLYGEAFRAPSTYEAKVGTDASYINNPNLVGEQARTIELVAQHRLASGVLASASVFNYRMRRLIDLTLDSATQLYMYRNVGSARSHGIEVGVDAHLGPLFSGFANYTFQRTRNESGVLLTNSPAHLGKFGAAAALRRWIRPALQVRWESGRRTVYDTHTSAYALADLNVVITPHVGVWNARGRNGKHGAGESFEMRLRLNNVFDRNYSTPGGIEHRQPAIRQDGRNLVAELRYHF